jgi:hypothetical protein
MVVLAIALISQLPVYRGKTNTDIHTFRNRGIEWTLRRKRNPGLSPPDRGESWRSEFFLAKRFDLVVNNASINPPWQQ